MVSDTSENDNRECEKEAGAIQRFFQRPFFLSLTIGIPFCLFKLLFGITLTRMTTGNDYFLTILGSVVLSWAAIDLLMNIGKSIADLIQRVPPFEYCTIAQLGRIFHKPIVFLAIDTLLTFGIVCFMLWSGEITKLTPFESYLWYSATTMNLISLSLVSVYNEIQKI